MSTLKTNNIEHINASTPSVEMSIGGGVVFPGISTFTGNATFNADVSIGGTLSYEDVTSIDSVGIITAQSGINVTGGSVGIGTDNPNRKLVVAGDSGIGAIQLQRTNVANNGNSYGTIWFRNSDDVDIAYIRSARESAIDDSNLIFQTKKTGENRSEKLRITSAGSVGIGTNNPGAKLEVHDNGIPRINTVYQGSKHFGMSVGGSGGGFVLTDGHFMAVNHQPYADRGTDNNLTERLRITSDGKVRIPDNGKFTAGDNDDLQISHDGATSIISGMYHPIEIRHQSEVHIKCVDDGAVELYYDNSKKLETTTTGVTVTGSLAVNGNNYPTAGPLSNRNLIINGAMQVAQRGTTSTANGYGTVDRIKVEYGQAQLTQYQLSLTSGAPYNEGFRYAHRMKVTTASNNDNSYAQFRTHLEGQNIAQSGWNYGDSNSTLVTSFWARSSLAGTYYVQYRFPDSSSSNYFNRAFTLSANTWTKITHTIPGRSGLVIDNDNGTGLQYVICAHYATDYTGSNATTDSYFTLTSNDYFPNFAQNFPNTLNATFDVTGIQLEVGSIATPFEHRSYGQTLAECERYFQRIHRPRLRGVAGSSSQLNRLGCTLQTTMRAEPTITSNGTFSWYDGSNTGTITTFGSTYSDLKSFEVEGTAASGSTATYRVIVIYRHTTSPAPYIDCFAEL
jgi:hypothetical protein